MPVKNLLSAIVALAAFATGAIAQNKKMVDVIDRGPVDVWMNHLEYRPFEKAEVGFTAPAGSYLLVLRVGDDGYTVRGFTTVEILYPRSFSSQGAVTAADAEASRTDFKMKGGPGTGGLVYAFASAKPFDLSRARKSFRWTQPEEVPFDGRRSAMEIAGRVVESLGVTLSDLLGASVDEYRVVSRYGKRVEDPNKSYWTGSPLDHRCAAGMVDSRCSQ